MVFAICSYIFYIQKLFAGLHWTFLTDFMSRWTACLRYLAIFFKYLTSILFILKLWCALMNFQKCYFYGGTFCCPKLVVKMTATTKTKATTPETIIKFLWRWKNLEAFLSLPWFLPQRHLPSLLCQPEIFTTLQCFLSYETSKYVNYVKINFVQCAIDRTQTQCKLKIK